MNNKLNLTTSGNSFLFSIKVWLTANMCGALWTFFYVLQPTSFYFLDTLKGFFGIFIISIAFSIPSVVAFIIAAHLINKRKDTIISKKNNLALFATIFTYAPTLVFLTMDITTPLLHATVSWIAALLSIYNYELNTYTAVIEKEKPIASEQ